MLIDYRRIDYVRGLKDYCVLHTPDQKYVVKGSIKSIEQFLPKGHFVRVHKSFIVSKTKIKSIYKNKLDLGAVKIPVGRKFKDRIDSFFMIKGD